MIKLTIIQTNPDWLEATWIEEVATTSIVENVKEEDKVETTILHCESFSGHREHIKMLKAKCLEFNTELTEDDMIIINEISEAFVYPTEEELLAYELDQKIQEAKAYLAQTDWVNTYKIRHDLGLEILPELSSKLIIINKREEYIVFLKGI